VNGKATTKVLVFDVFLLLKKYNIFIWSDQIFLKF